MASLAADAPLPPILRLPEELHLEVVSHLQDNESRFSLIRLRLVNRFFHKLMPAPSHDELMVLEHTQFARNNSLYACKHCIRLRSSVHFASSMLKGKTGLNGSYAWKRFCADCGFSVDQNLGAYAAGVEGFVGGVRWVRCRHCNALKKGNEAGYGNCSRGCRSCFSRFGCQCAIPCIKIEAPSQAQIPVGGTRIATTSRKNHRDLYYNASDTESDRGEDEDDVDWSMVYDDDDWRAFT
ncbi:hypothetical protein HBI23_251530 [Parastagonospora nodorum]|nr:hypothetical protein HBI23_251530 [Parastagonospora nodorum]KAH5621668.1 hypothetical protein HBI51_249550 [Parastagonospora nodorum]KAH5983418.1 hypothetical protein HBI84_246630 [Parastagonospora nodorum]KAH6383940.1 hypothetical protein HBI60_253270 [Parastagonospora nodorum]KAH6516771.1 hypothetical protein HBI07_248450 [Parastagonospora nodorum]